MAAIDLQQITLDDALNDPDPLDFTPPKRAQTTARITCRVCGRHEDVPILSSGLLCSLCRVDLAATERHIKETLAAAELRFQNVTDAWEAAYAQATPEDQQRYHAVEEARAANAPWFQAKYQKALGKGDGLSTLLKTKEQCDEQAEQVQGRLAVWADAALEEVREARDA